MLVNLIPKDEVDNDTHYHNKIRKQMGRPIQTADDREYSPEEIRTAIEALHSKKAPGENGITNEIIKLAHRQFLKLIFTLYNLCFNQGCFPKLWKRVKLIPITKPGKESTNVPSKYRTTNLKMSE